MTKYITFALDDEADALSLQHVLADYMQSKLGLLHDIDWRMSDEPTMTATSEINRARTQRWHGGGKRDWSVAEWTNALGGEVGELLDAIIALISASGTLQNTGKKILRHETALAERSWNTPELADLLAQAQREIADVHLYNDLVAGHLGLSLYEAVRDKFNMVSEAQQFPERMP